MRTEKNAAIGRPINENGIKNGLFLSNAVIKGKLGRTALAIVLLNLKHKLVKIYAAFFKP